MQMCRICLGHSSATLSTLMEGSRCSASMILGLRHDVPSPRLFFLLWSSGLRLSVSSRSAWFRRGEEFSAEIKGACQRSKQSLWILWRGRRRDSSEKPSTWSAHSGAAEYGHMGGSSPPPPPMRVSHTKRNRGLCGSPQCRPHLQRGTLRGGLILGDALGCRESLPLSAHAH